MQARAKIYANGILLPAAWIVLIILKSGAVLKDGFHFLCKIESPQPGDQGQFYSKDDVWRMHEGTIAILGLVIFGSSLIYGLVTRRRIGATILKEPTGKAVPCGT